MAPVHTCKAGRLRIHLDLVLLHMSQTLDRLLQVQWARSRQFERQWQREVSGRGRAPDGTCPGCSV